jgi:hypothetical protein
MKSRPPQWVFTADIPEEVVMFVWPGSDRARIPMPALRQYFKEKYLAMDMGQGK